MIGGNNDERHELDFTPFADCYIECTSLPYRRTLILLSSLIYTFRRDTSLVNSTIDDVFSIDKPHHVNTPSSQIKQTQAYNRPTGNFQGKEKAKS